MPLLKKKLILKISPTHAHYLVLFFGQTWLINQISPRIQFNGQGQTDMIRTAKVLQIADKILTRMIINQRLPIQPNFIDSHTKSTGPNIIGVRIRRVAVIGGFSTTGMVI